MPEYHKQTIEVIINKESDVYQRVCKVAESEGRSIEDIVDTIASVGLAYFMESNLRLIYGRENK